MSVTVCSTPYSYAAAMNVVYALHSKFENAD